MGIFLRKLWQNKPKQFGPWKFVHESLMENAERIGINPADIVLAMPMWNPGDQISYSKNALVGTNNGSTYAENKLNFDGNDFVALPSLDDSLDFTVFAEASFNSYSTQSVVIDIAARSDNNATNWAIRGNSSGHLATFVRGHTGEPSLEVEEDLRNTGLRKIAVTHEPNVAANMYLDSLNKSDFTGLTTTAFSASTDRAAIGVMYDSTPSSYHDGSINHILKINSVLSDSILNNLFENPWQLWQPRTPTFYSFPSGESILLTINSLLQSQALSTPNIIQHNLLAIQNLAQSQSLVELDLIQNNILAVSNIQQVQTLENLELTQANLLAISNLLQSQGIENIELTQANLLAISNLLQSQDLDNISFSVSLILEIANLAQAQTIENLNLTQANILAINHSLQSQILENIELTQANVLVINEVTQAQNLDNISFSIASLLEIANLAQAQGLEIVNIIQHNNLVVDGIVQAQSLDNITLELATLLQIANIIQSQDIENIGLTQANILVINNLLQSQGLTNISFTLANGKVTITFALRKPSINQEINIPIISFDLD